MVNTDGERERERLIHLDFYVVLNLFFSKALTKIIFKVLIALFLA